MGLPKRSSRKTYSNHRVFLYTGFINWPRRCHRISGIDHLQDADPVPAVIEDEKNHNISLKKRVMLAKASGSTFTQKQQDGMPLWANR